MTAPVHLHENYKTSPFTKPVVERAKEILRNLEESELTPEGSVRQSPHRQQDRAKLQQLAPAPQMDLFAL